MQNSIAVMNSRRRSREEKKPNFKPDLFLLNVLYIPYKLNSLPYILKNVGYEKWTGAVLYKL